jgi:hypothetical protein
MAIANSYSPDDYRALRLTTFLRNNATEPKLVARLKWLATDKIDLHHFLAVDGSALLVA